jgi:hypothetical protein
MTSGLLETYLIIGKVRPFPSYCLGVGWTNRLADRLGGLIQECAQGRMT